MARISNQIPVAAGNKHPFDLSFSHVTTMDFMQLQPVGYRHTLDDETLDMTAFATVRPAPIEVPTFGRCHLSLRSFFVPYELIFPNWHAFKQDVITSNYSKSSLVSGVPYFTASDLWTMITDARCSSVVTAGGDFIAGATQYKLTLLGRHINKILNCLGYKIIPFIKDAANTNITFNALGLLAYCKVYVDWYANKNYLNSTEILLCERLFKFNDPTTSLHLIPNDILNLLSLCVFACYDNESYFLDSWDNPIGPNSGQFSAFMFLDPTATNGSFIQTNSVGSPEMIQYSAGSTQVGTQFTHDMMKRLTDYQRRHALAGAHQIERFLAEAGYVPESLKLTRSVYIGHQNIDINVGDVYGTSASTDGSNTSTIGDYAGRAFGQGSKNWHYVAEQQGLYVVVGCIVPDSCFVQGYDRNNRLNSKTQFFTNEFDGLSTQICEKGEVYVSNDSNFYTNVDDYTGKYSFTGRYGEKKRPLNFLTGDFTLPNHFTGGSSWHFYRLFSDASFNNLVSNVTHSLAITRGSDAYMLDRIFQYTNVDFDHFYVFIDFDFHTQSRCKPLFDTYEFDEESAKSITIGSGPKVN